jgi:arylsulfatase A-like enzyme
MKPDRRSIVKGIATLAAAGAFPTFALPERRRPNFLFIMADDLGFADLSCYGREDYATPHIDALARQGVQCMHAYANSAVCTATRVGLITGRYQYRLPIGLEEPLGVRDVGLPPEHPTIASLLRKAGYSTSLIGKWHLGSLPKYGPAQSGYEHFWGIRGGGVDYFSHGGLGEGVDLWDGNTPVHQTGYLTDLLGDQAIRMLEDHAKADRPFLLSLHFTAPHWPWEGPGDLAESQRLEKLKAAMKLADFDGGTRKTYAEMVVRLDQQVGRIKAALTRLKLDRDTVVVFTSDNGGERFSKTWPLSGRKTELLEGGIRVPLIVRWPGVTHAGTRSDAPIISMDWLPTFVAAAGSMADPALPPDGIDVRAALQGGTLPDRALYWRYRNHGQQAMRHGDWKYLQIAGKAFLFNLADDPMERANLKVREAARFATMQADWTRWNSTMLPFDPESSSHGFTEDDLADHYGVTEPR